MEKKLVGDLYLDKDPIVFLDFLSDHFLCPKSYKSGFSLTKIYENNFYLLIFIKGKDKDDEFLMFRVANFPESTEAMIDLNEHIINKIGSDRQNYFPAQRKLQEVILQMPAISDMLVKKTK